jgi:hypothetical protein
MLKEEKNALKSEFNRIIDSVPKTKQQELHNDLSVLNNHLNKYDLFLVNWGQSFVQFFTSNITKKMKNFVDDILDGYDKGKGYELEDRLLVKNTLAKIIEKYDSNNRTLLDKLLSVLGFS